MTAIAATAVQPDLPAAGADSTLRRMLHVTNGDSAAEKLREAGLQGLVAPWRDILHEGPVPAGLDAAALREVRVRYLAEHGWAGEERVRADLEERDARLAQAVEGRDEIVLWFESDLYDMLQLAQVLDRLPPDVADARHRGGGGVHRRRAARPARAAGRLRGARGRRQGAAGPRGRGARARGSRGVAGAAQPRARAPGRARRRHARPARARRGRPALPAAVPVVPLRPEPHGARAAAGRGRRRAHAARGVRGPPAPGGAAVHGRHDRARVPRRAARGARRAPHEPAPVHPHRRGPRGARRRAQWRGRPERWLGGVHLPPGKPRWCWDPAAGKLV